MATVPNRAIFFTAWSDPITLEFFPVSTNALITDQPQLDRIKAAQVAWLDLTFNPAAPVAIGNTTPNTGAFTTLTGNLIRAGADGSAAAPAITRVTDLDSGLFFPAADQIAASVGGAEKWRQTATGFGFGTTAPAAALHVASGASATGPTPNSAAGNSLLVGGTAGYGLALGNNVANGDSWLQSMAWAGGVAAYNLLLNPVGGRVGIGEIAPDYLLDINGTLGFAPGASVTPVDNGDVVFEATDNTTFTIKHKGSDGVVRSGTVTLA